MKNRISPCGKTQPMSPVKWCPCAPCEVEREKRNAERDRNRPSSSPIMTRGGKTFMKL